MIPFEQAKANAKKVNKNVDTAYDYGCMWIFSVSSQKDMLTGMPLCADKETGNTDYNFTEYFKHKDLLEPCAVDYKTGEPIDIL